MTNDNGPSALEDVGALSMLDVNNSTSTARFEEISESKINLKQRTFVSKIGFGNNPMPHKPSKYHYHLKVDHIYGDKILKLCGQCTQPSNLAKDLRFLNKNMKQPSMSNTAVDESSINHADTRSAESVSSNNHKHQSYSNAPPGGLRKLGTRDILVLHRTSMLALQDASKTNIEFDVLDLSSGRQSGPNLPIVVLPLDLFRFTQLKRLHLDCNQIRIVPHELGLNLINLEILTLSNNCLKMLPESFENLKKLNSLHLSSNQFEKFPSVIGRLESLKFLDLCSNRLSYIDAEIGNLSQLESLLLFHNNLRELPPQIGQLVSIRTLWLGCNRLTKLPREIVQLVHLDWNDDNLSLSSNIERNPLEEPPTSVCANGLAAIKKYFEENSNDG